MTRQRRRPTGGWRLVTVATSLITVVGSGAAASTTPTSHPSHPPAHDRAPAARGRHPAQVQAAVNAPGSAFDCDTPRAAEWFGSTQRCLRELCAGGNYTNEYVTGFDNRLRKNPCYGRSPDEHRR